TAHGHTAEDRAGVGQLLVMSTRIPPESMRIANRTGSGPNIRSACSAPTPAPQKSSVPGGTICAFKGFAQNQAGIPTTARVSADGVNNERTKSRGTAKSDGSGGDAKQKSQCQTGKAGSRCASASGSAVARYVRRGREPGSSRPVQRPDQSPRFKRKKGLAIMPMDES